MEKVSPLSLSVELLHTLVFYLKKEDRSSPITITPISDGKATDLALC